LGETSFVRANGWRASMETTTTVGISAAQNPTGTKKAVIALSESFSNYFLIENIIFPRGRH
jgi:hypothetical protein